jgi:outer membrane protein TolC
MAGRIETSANSPPALPAGLPSDLRERRPDVASAERVLASNNAQIGVARALYREGLANYLEVITAEEELLTNQRLADQVHEQRLLTTIQLYHALGSGWRDSTIYTPGTPVPHQSSGLPGH